MFESKVSLRTFGSLTEVHFSRLFVYFAVSCFWLQRIQVYIISETFDAVSPALFIVKYFIICYTRFSNENGRSSYLSKLCVFLWKQAIFRKCLVFWKACACISYCQLTTVLSLQFLTAPLILPARSIRHFRDFDNCHVLSGIVRVISPLD